MIVLNRCEVRGVRKKKIIDLYTEIKKYQVYAGLQKAPLKLNGVFVENEITNCIS